VGEHGPGETVGETSLLTGGKRNGAAKAVEESLVGRMDALVFEYLVAGHPQIRRELMKIVTWRVRNAQWRRILYRYFGSLDPETSRFFESRLEWVHVERNDVLFRQEEPGDSLFFLVHGLLHIVDEAADGSKELIGPVYRGEIVGEMAILTGERRSAGVYAVRDSDVVKVTKTAFKEICDAYPAITLGIIRILVERLKRRAHLSARRGAVNIALVPASTEVPLRDFADRLADAFPDPASVAHVASRDVDRKFAIDGIAQITEEDPRAIGLIAWLEELESTHAIVLYEADADASAWTERCIHQADQVLLAARAGDDPEPGPLERAYLRETGSITEAKEILVLIHREDRKLPAGTRAWLEGRRLAGLHHLRWESGADFRRLARIMSGTAVGLVLSGGGAKGMAHIGVIRALEEKGVPIDMIGGTSIGAVVAAAHAMGMKYERMIKLSKLLFQKVNPFGEFTIPVISLIRSRKLDRVARLAYKDVQIEDLWLSYFCVTCNLTSSDLKVHREGPLWKAVRTSASLPGIAVPVMWDGQVHVDGGVLNNLPGDIMRRQAGVVIVVDVNPPENLKAEIEEFPSPWKMIWSRIAPWKKPVDAPNIFDILIATITASSRKSGSAVKEDADLCLTPSLAGFGLVDFKDLERAAQVGYDYTKARIENLTDKALLAKLGIKSAG
jgi:NTE family protein/lysophospholipid hydrolase